MDKLLDISPHDIILTYVLVELMLDINLLRALICWRPSFSSRQKPPLERSSTRRYVSSDSRCFLKAVHNLSFLSFVHIVTDAPCADTLFSGLAVFDYRPL